MAAKKQKDSSFLLYLAGLVLFLAIFTGFALLNKETKEIAQATSTPTPMVLTVPEAEVRNWKTYNVEVLRATFKYPRNLYSGNDVRGVVGGRVFLSSRLLTAREFSEGGGAVIDLTPGPINSLERTASSYGYDPYDVDDISRWQPIKVGEIVMYKFEKDKEVLVFFETKEGLWVFSFYEGLGVSRETFYKILSTFKFTE